MARRKNRIARRPSLTPAVTLGFLFTSLLCLALTASDAPELLTPWIRRAAHPGHVLAGAVMIAYALGLLVGLRAGRSAARSR